MSKRRLKPLKKRLTAVQQARRLARIERRAAANPMKTLEGNLT